MIELNDDCWRHVISFLYNHHHTLLQLTLTSKFLFRYAVAELYKCPLIQFLDLSDETRATLEDSLLYQLCRIPLALNHPWHNNPTYISAALDASKVKTRQPTIEYGLLVQEMPDNPCAGSASYNDGTENGILLYRCMFGSKIKKACLSTNENDLLEQSIGLLSGLQELTVKDVKNFGCTESTYNIVRAALTTHRAMYPRVLQKATFLLSEYRGGRYHSDAKMMMTIRDAMGGQWCTDKLILKITDEVDQDMLTLLEDVDLPNQLRSIEMVQENQNPGDHWTQPLRAFLSRCKQLDSINFHGFVPTNLLGWASDENKSKEESDSAANLKKYQWKSIKFTHPKFGSLFHDAPSEIEQLKNLWEVFVFGFGHCAECLVFETSDSTPPTMELFPMLSLPESVQLPKLRELRISYPYFYRLAYSGIDQLQKLSFKVTRLHTDIAGGNKWDDWKLWTSVEELQFRVDSTDSEVELFYDNEVPFDSRQKEQLDFTDLPRPFSLPKLKFVTISNQAATKLNPNILLIGPNIRSLVLHVEPTFPYTRNFDYTRVMNWSWFFQEASTRSITFPRLKSLKTPVALELTPSYLMHHFLGIASCGNDALNLTGPSQKGCLFPSLEHLAFGALVDKKIRTGSSSGVGSRGGNQMVDVRNAESCFIPTMQKCLQLEFDEIGKSRFGDNNASSGNSDNHLRHRILTFYLPSFAAYGSGTWRAMFWSQEGRKQSDERGFAKSMKSGIVIKCSSYSFFFETRLALV